MQKCLPRSVCGDSKHSGARQEFVLAIIWHSCDNPCWLQVCGQPKHVYLEMNLKSRATGNAHNDGWMQGGMQPHHWNAIQSQRGGTEDIAQRPGRKQWRKWAKGLPQIRTFLYWEAFAEDCPVVRFCLVCIQGPLQYASVVMQKRARHNHAYLKQGANPHPASPAYWRIWMHKIKHLFISLKWPNRAEVKRGDRGNKTKPFEGLRW